MNRDQEHKDNYQKRAKKLLRRQNAQSQVSLTVTTSIKAIFCFSFGFCFNPRRYNAKKNFNKAATYPEKTISSYKKPTDATYNFLYHNKKEIVQHRNNLHHTIRRSTPVVN